MAQANTCAGPLLVNVSMPLPPISALRIIRNLRGSINQAISKSTFMRRI